MIQEIDKLFDRQIKLWPALAKGAHGLAKARTRSVRIDWFEVFVRHIPHRVASTTAAVDPGSISKRPCFLCRENQDSEQQGIAFGNEFILYCNPFPIVNRHLTIIHRDHGVQRIAGHMGNMLELAQALEGLFIIYNGPECGASAPDHMHFQAGSRELFPIEAETADKPGPTIENYARNVLLFRGADRRRLAGRVDDAVEIIAAATGKRPEPLINLAAFYDSRAGWTVYLFPRGKHRPRVFETGELTVSPASIDLCGIFVVPLEEDFKRISGEDIRSIYREVTLPDEQFGDVACRVVDPR